jgi:hypothetical protein
MLVSHNLNIICAAKRRGREAKKGVSINDIATVFNAKRISLISVNITRISRQKIALLCSGWIVF